MDIKNLKSVWLKPALLNFYCVYVLKYGSDSVCLERTLRFRISNVLPGWIALMVSESHLEWQSFTYLSNPGRSLKIQLWSLWLSTGTLVWDIHVLVKIAFEFYNRNIIKINP